MQILAKTKFALNESECLLSSFLVQVSQKWLFIDGVSIHVHVLYYVHCTDTNLAAKATDTLVPTFS
jgi:hypothetical protein